MSSVRIEPLDGLPVAARSIEIVERKGLGHPDTICDFVSESLSVALSRHYLDRFGLILHHNVDKALLAAGRSRPAFGGGEVIEPIDLYLSGRAAVEFGGKRVPVEDLARASIGAWFRDHFHALDPDRHVRVHCLTRPGSPELVDLFVRQREQGLVLCNDTSCGVGFAPLSDLERVVLAVERRLNAPDTKAAFPACGQDIKVMGIREEEAIRLTIACALIGRFLSGPEAYAESKERVAKFAKEAARSVTARPVEVEINAADDPARGAIYLTVSGTSAESGDDGETGRGNRANGLITPLRPMTLEAVAGKNPLTHVGKLYQVAAQQIAESIVGDIAEVEDAECYLVSRIGAPIDRPQIALVRVRTADGHIGQTAKATIEDAVARHLAGVGRLWQGFVSGTIPVS